MIENLAKYFTVYASSMVKFIFGPLEGMAFGLQWYETFGLTVLGMMTSVFLFSFLGTWLKKYVLNKINANRKTFTKRSRNIVTTWNKYGLHGVAFLTPILFTPIGGTIIATSFGESKRRILSFMFVSALFWGFILSFGIFTFKNTFIN
ncbi:MAG: hypothetical protein K2Q22_03425 [Cytophagales bacterium]|nr:hypothetical protein [Cytophagales bacterium]